MKNLALVLLAFSLQAQEVPGRYIVELSEPPALDVAVRGRRVDPQTLSTPRYGPLFREQERFRVQLRRLGGEVSASMSNLINAVSIAIPPGQLDMVRRLPGVAVRCRGNHLLASRLPQRKPVRRVGSGTALCDCLSFTKVELSSVRKRTGPGAPPPAVWMYHVRPLTEHLQASE